MENKNEKAQELEIEQLETVSGGGSITTCEICGASFTDYRKFLAHRMECNRPMKDGWKPQQLQWHP